VPASHQDHRVDQLCQEIAGTPFDLGRDTTPRCLLLRLDTERWVLMVVLHHISADGWALRTVLRELAELYRSAVTATPPALPVPVAQCTDYARWQRAHADPAAEERGIAFLRERLRRSRARVDVPTDRPRTAAATGAGGTVYVPVPETVRKAVEDLARARHATPFAVIAAGFARWLAELTREPDVVLFMGYANRERLEFEPMVSFTAIPLAVPVHVGDGDAFGELVARTAVGIMESIGNAVPLTRVLPDTPNVLLVFYDNVYDVVRFPGLETVAVDDVAPPASRRELTFGVIQLEDAADGYQAWLEYSSDLWDRESAVALVRDYVTVLEVACAASRVT
jgi:hypothetical protein